MSVQCIVEVYCKMAEELWNAQVYEKRGIWDEKRNRCEGARMHTPGVSASSPARAEARVRAAVPGADESFSLRALGPADILAVKALCIKAFPIEYPSSWYEEVVSGHLISRGIFTPDGKLVALIIAECKLLIQCNAEDRDILGDVSSEVVYILSLAVDSEYRRKGFASRLLLHLLDLARQSLYSPKAVFLHVLSSNHSAIAFYNRHGFQHHDTLSRYYRLPDGYGDGWTYVLYMNGGWRPYAWKDVCRSLSYFFCSPFSRLLKQNAQIHTA